MPNSPQDVHKKVLGRKGEKAVEKFLKKSGLKILHRNFQTPFGEADLVAEENDEIVFIEVKTRASNAYGSGVEAVGKTKKERYYKIARYYGLQTGEEVNARFDVAEVDGDWNINYYKNAF
ncbi:MAG: YraN family protein [Clostridiales bacterium]|nr:YraN family protein [Clostridiales bacterium]